MGAHLQKAFGQDVEKFGEGTKSTFVPPPKLSKFVEKIRIDERNVKPVTDGTFYKRFIEYMLQSGVHPGVLRFIQEMKHVEQVITEAKISKKEDDYQNAMSDMEHIFDTYFGTSFWAPSHKVEIPGPLAAYYVDLRRSLNEKGISFKGHRLKKKDQTWAEGAPIMFKIFKDMEDRVCADIAVMPDNTKWQKWYKAKYGAPRANTAYLNFQREYGYSAHDINRQNLLGYEGYDQLQGQRGQFVGYNGIDANDSVVGIGGVIFAIFLMVCVVSAVCCVFCVFAGYLYGSNGTRPSPKWQKLPNSDDREEI